MQIKTFFGLTMRLAVSNLETGFPNLCTIIYNYNVCFSQINYKSSQLTISEAALVGNVNFWVKFIYVLN